MKLLEDQNPVTFRKREGAGDESWTESIQEVPNPPTRPQAQFKSDTTADR
jgi:hypothetical protein